MPGSKDQQWRGDPPNSPIIASAPRTGGIVKLRPRPLDQKARSAKNGFEVSKGGTLALGSPGNPRDSTRTISLLMIEDGQWIEAGTNG